MTVRAGDLDRRIALQRKVTAISESGDLSETWSILVTRWSSIDPATGSEVNASDQWIAKEQTKFVIRWSPEVDDLSPLDRLICPASDAGASPEKIRSVYDIISVQEIGRHESLRIVAARRVA